MGQWPTTYIAVGFPIGELDMDEILTAEQFEEWDDDGEVTIDNQCINEIGGHESAMIGITLMACSGYNKMDVLDFDKLKSLSDDAIALWKKLKPDLEPKIYICATFS